MNGVVQREIMLSLILSKLFVQYWHHSFYENTLLNNLIRKTGVIIKESKIGCFSIEQKK